MKNYMVIAGCSHSSGSEIDGTLDSKYNREHSFGNLFAQKMGYIPINIATPGATNQLVARHILRWFAENKDIVNNKTNNVALLVNWTESIRVEAPFEFPADTSFPSADWQVDQEQFIQINPGYTGYSAREKEKQERYHRFIAHEVPFCEILSLQMILMIQYFCQANNYRYFMSSAGYVFTEENLPWTRHYMRLVNDKHYYNFRTKEDAFYEKFKLRGHVNHKAKYGHHDEAAHKAHADDLYNYFKRKGV
jgi:hypothetical protein